MTGAGVAVGGTRVGGIAVGGAAVATRVLVGVCVTVAVGVAVAGSGVAVGVLVGGAGVAVGGTRVAVAVGVMVGGTGVKVGVAVRVGRGGTVASSSRDAYLGSTGNAALNTWLNSTRAASATTTMIKVLLFTIHSYLL